MIDRIRILHIPKFGEKEPFVAGHLWITYAWADNNEGDFDYLVAQLAQGGIIAQFDRIALVPGQRLWDQIAEHIGSDDLAAWAYLLTPQSIESQPCREELAYALEHALSKKDTGFPLIGMLHGVPISTVPVPLRVRLCIDLASPNWIEEVQAGLERRAPAIPSAGSLNFKTRLHNAYLGNQSLKAIEFVTRFGELRYWRIAHPSSGARAVIRGVGPAGGGGVGGSLRDFVEGTVDLNGVPMFFFGSGDPISPSTAAYVAFESAFPTEIAFGWAAEPFGVPAEWWPMKVS